MGHIQTGVKNLTGHERTVRITKKIPMDILGVDTFHTHRSKGRLILKYMGVDVDYSEHLCTEMQMACFW